MFWVKNNTVLVSEINRSHCYNYIPVHVYILYEHQKYTLYMLAISIDKGKGICVHVTL
jgi:hypothetical protein